ncbi:MAG: serine hydrolase domain-containing protein [Candidatus Lutacidiplasmatales archaeon]
MTRPQVTTDYLTERWARRWNVPGASMAIVERGRAPVFKAYGFRDRAARLPATQHTVYGLASVTKSCTALAIMRLEEDGKLSTRDPIVRHLPEFRTADARATRRITIHHFLTHTSGLPPLPSIAYAAARSLTLDPYVDARADRRGGIDPDHSPIDTYEQMMDFLGTARYRLLGPPGRWFSYSNEAFGLLGAVIERASGRTFESCLEEEILRPAGMRSTTFDSGIMYRYPEVTTLYSPKPTGARHRLVPSQVWGDAPCLRGCGGLRSNVEDLARYLQIFLGEGKVDGERIVAAASVRKMTTAHAEWLPGLHYGYGVLIRPDYYGNPLIYHSGASPGISSLFALSPERGLGGVVLTNVGGVHPELALMPELNARLGLPPRALMEEVPKSTEARTSLSEYEGWFGCGEGLWFEVKTRRNDLWFDFHATMGNLRGIRLRPAGHDRFVFRWGGRVDQAKFERDAHLRVFAVSLFARLIRRRNPKDFPRARKLTIVW